MNQQQDLDIAVDAPERFDSAKLKAWKERLFEHVSRREKDALAAVQPALHAHPADPELLLLAALAALLDKRPDQSLRYQHRFSKKFRPIEAEDHLLHALALAQQERWAAAAQILKQQGYSRLHGSLHYLPCGWSLMSWIRGWLNKIQREENRRAAPEVAKLKKPVARSLGKASKDAPAKNASIPAVVIAPLETTAGIEVSPDLPRFDAQIPVTISLPPATLDTVVPTEAGANVHLTAFRLRYELMNLGLLQGFDELLCVSALRNVETYWFQTEAARKVLKQFRGRVLLADEVGLGKTIEAGMVLKEYLLRGMVERVLILTPATLVGQWQEEMRTKFDVTFATSYDHLLRQDPVSFWAQPRVIASIATARRAEHFALLADQHYDLVIVDEAHHLKNRQTQNWKLVNALQKRFLLLLSATPVQNNLIELYNLLTLLKPGIFKTEKEFRQSYMTSGHPRVPANRERMRDLMRDVMIRNTRSLVDVRLPPRHAVTMRLEAGTEEAACYAEVSRLVQHAYASEAAPRRLALKHLLSAAGSTPATAAAAIERFATATKERQTSKTWRDLARRYELLALGQLTGKETALIELLRRNPEEKKIVFVHHRETLERLARLMAVGDAIPFVRFEGSMTGPEKDEAIARFRDEVPLLLSSKSGGEGRNLQFCNTLINFDLPWNPMAIEQRIGRIHRIGQTREVFIFNLVMRGTLEEQVLHILDEKINMFELVVGEIDQILGEMDDEGEFAEMVFTAWVETTEAGRQAAFDALGEQLVAARSHYESIKALDEELFGEEFVAG